MALWAGNRCLRDHDCDDAVGKRGDPLGSPGDGLLGAADASQQLRLGPDVSRRVAVSEVGNSLDANVSAAPVDRQLVTRMRAGRAGEAVRVDRVADVRGTQGALCGVLLPRGRAGAFEAASGWAQAGPRQVREGLGRTEESLRLREIGIVDRAEDLVKPGQLEQALHGPWTAHDHEAPPAPLRSLVSLRQHV